MDKKEQGYNSGVSFLHFAVETTTVFIEVKNWLIVLMEVETTENRKTCSSAGYVAIPNYGLATRLARYTDSNPKVIAPCYRYMEAGS